MDEQRINAYVELVQALLSCPSGQEPAVLQQHQDLLDEGLLQVMAQVAERLQQQGQEKNARWLAQISAQLAQAMGAESSSSSELAMSSDLQSILQALSQPSDLRGMAQRVALCRQALSLVSQQDNENLWASLQVELGNSLTQNPQGDRAQNIEEAIKVYEQSLQVTTREAMPLEWAQSMINLANAYADRIQGDRAQNIEEAIKVYKQSLEVITREAMPVDWATSMMNLATAYVARLQGDRAQNIEEAIKAYEQSLQVTTRVTMPLEWSQSMMNLGIAYASRIRGDRAQNIEAAIQAFQQSLEVITREAMPVDWATSMMNLATAYVARLQGDRAQNIEEAIKAYEQSLQVMTCEAMPLEWAQSMMNLANAYADCIRGDRAQNIEEAIKVYEQSLQVMTREAMPVDWATSMMNLGIAYANRIQSDRAQNIEEAIKVYKQSLEVITREAMPLEWAQSMMNLANAYVKRIQGDRAQNIEEAIKVYKQSLEVITREAMPLEWAQSMMNLAVAYVKRIQGNRAQNIEVAIGGHQRSLEVITREAMPLEWAQSMMNLANAYVKRIQGDRAQNIEEAIKVYKQSLEVITREAMPLEWAQSMMNLANAYADRIQGDRAQNIEEAIKAYEQALEVFTPETHPYDCRRTARLLANIHTNEAQWNKAQICYEKALNAVEVLYQAALFKSSQEVELSETHDLYRRAAYTYSKVGNFIKAVATLEQGRARGLSETLQRNRADLETIRQINPELVERYQTAANAINQLESTERRLNTDDSSPQYSQEDFRQQAIQDRQSLKDCLTEIRQIPKYENFLAIPNFNDVAATVQPNHPLVYLVSTPNGSLALMPTVKGISHLWLNDLTEPQLLNLLNENWFKAYRERQTNHQAWLDAIDKVTHQLWNSMMAPLIDHLQQHNLSKAILIPTGYLSYLPLHAAWTPDTTQPNGRRYAIDAIQFTYAPNALSLKAARAITNQTAANTLLAINEPQPVNAGNLPSSSDEVAKAISTFPDKRNWTLLQQDKATRKAVLEQLPKKNVVHFSCHGFADFATPLDSGLLMANNEILSLRDLLDLKLQNLRLAILSACETCIPGAKLPDEVISLPTGLLQAGAAGVVSALWSVDELSTMVLLSRFYHFWRTENLDPPEALRRAQIWLRDSNGPTLASCLQNSHPDIAQQLEQAHSQRPFDHPFHWAGFNYVGA